MRRLFVLIVLMAPILFFACSDDNNNVVGDQPVNTDRPAIPEPSTYDGSVPTISERMLIKRVRLTNFTAPVDSALLCRCGLGGDYLCIMFPIKPDANRIRLVADDTIVTDYEEFATFTNYSSDPDSWGDACTQQLEAPRPYIQLVRYWVRLGVPERYSGSTSKTTTRTTTRGITNTTAQEFTKSLGVEATVGGSWFVDFSVTVKTEFSWTESQATSITEEESFQESFTITCPEGKNLVYCVWQLVDEFSIVDSTGQETYTAPNYVFDTDALISSIPTEDLVPMTTYFDN